MKRLLPILLLVFSVGVGAETIEYLGGTYTGQLVNGVPHGEGTATSSDDAKDVGEWKDGMKHGRGIYTWPNEKQYAGEWKNDKPHGQGTQTWADGGKYVGEWKAGKTHGQGTETWVNGAKYIGEYKDGNQHGDGVMRWTDGRRYEGEFKDSLPHGFGTFIYANGDKYVGEWKDNKKHGQGTFTWPGGGKYVGEWKAGKTHGQGTQTWADGVKYVGEWEDGKMHGQGTYTWASGNKYVGEYKNGKKYGQGTRTWPNGNKYVGEWRGYAMWQGTTYNPSGEVIEKYLDGMPAPACDGNPESGQGTGFAVSPHHVVTNAHVLYCCKKVMVYNLPSCFDEIEAAIVTTEQRSDLGLLRLDTPLKHYATLRSGKELQLGDAVTTYDSRIVDTTVSYCPQDSVEQGKVTKLNWMPDDARMMEHDSPVSHGSSGGPVLDASGHIVGVTRSVFGLNTNWLVSNAVKIDLLEAFLKSNNVDYHTASSTETLSLSEIKKRSDKFTVLIECIQ